MRKSLMFAASLLTLGAGFVAPLTAEAFQGANDPLHPVLSMSGRVRHVVRNANDCAPWAPVAVWGSGSHRDKLIGYRCVDHSNGG